MNVQLVKQYCFEAAHTTDWQGARRLHGHSYVVDLVVCGLVNEHLGWLVDYGEITTRFNPLYKQIDHYLLDTIPGMTDVSVAGVRQWILERLRSDLPQLEDVRVRVVGPCAFEPVAVVSDRIRFGFEAAHFLPRLPDDHKCKRMHGHSFSVEAGLRDAASAAMALREVYDALDHRCLNDIPGLDNPTSENVCRWIWGFMAGRGAIPTALSVAETCTARCEYYGT